MVRKKKKFTRSLHKPLNTSVYIKIPYKNEIQMRSSNLIVSEDPSLDIEDTTLISLLTQPTELLIMPFNNRVKMNQLLKREVPTTVESVSHFKNLTLMDKLNVYNNYIQNTNYLKILQAESISNVPAFSNLSKMLLREISMKLWLPTKINFQDSPLTLLNGSFVNIKPNSWFSIKQLINPENKNSQKIFSQLFMSSLMDKMEKENIKLIQNQIQAPNPTPNQKLNQKLNQTSNPKQNKKEKPQTLRQNMQKAKLNVEFDETKKGCVFIMVANKSIDGVKYGRICNNKCSDDNKLCDDHIDADERDYDLMAEHVCEHIITQKSRNSDRKGMKCGQFTFDSKNPKYCKYHISNHNEEIIDKDTCLRSFDVRFYPTKEQCKLFATYFGCHRFTYNKCVENNEDDTFENLRNKYVINIDKDSFLRKTPKAIRDSSVLEYVTGKSNAEKAYLERVENEMWKRANYTNYKSKDVKKPEMKYKKKKGDQSILISKNNVRIKNKTIGIYPDFFKNEPLRLIGCSKKDKRLNKILDGVLYHDIRIIKTETNKYYICFLDDVIKVKQDENKEIIAGAVDPGCRTMGTLYSEKEILEYGSDMNKELGDIMKQREELRKKYRTQIELRKSFNNDKAYDKAKHDYKLINEKIKNKVNDLHYKVINKLTNEYSLIFIPLLNTKRMLEETVLRPVTKRQLQAESHGKFIKRLEEKAEVVGVTIKRVTEHMTTKLCSRCFEYNDPKDSKIYRCSNCELIIGRDINASRNMYIQQLAEIIAEMICAN